MAAGSGVSEARVKLEFRKVLGRISDGLGTENVRALKNLCYDSISERKREEIDSGIHLFNVLIEEGAIAVIDKLKVVQIYIL